MTKDQLIEALKDYRGSESVLMEVITQTPGVALGHVDYVTTDDKGNIRLKEFIG